ncbi:MAG: hypothetical protein OXE58_15915 [Acidobacteria bacterium]|nr:hypothetical protein [Acidobacteriota bacterium]
MNVEEQFVASPDISMFQGEHPVVMRPRASGISLFGERKTEECQRFGVAPREAGATQLRLEKGNRLL